MSRCLAWHQLQKFLDDAARSHVRSSTLDRARACYACMLNRSCRIAQYVKYMAVMQVPKTALKTPFQQGTVQDVAKKMLQLSRDGLARRGKHEETFLDPLQEIVDVCSPRNTAPSLPVMSWMFTLECLCSCFPEKLCSFVCVTIQLCCDNGYWQTLCAWCRVAKQMQSDGWTSITTSGTKAWIQYTLRNSPTELEGVKQCKNGRMSY